MPNGNIVKYIKKNPEVDRLRLVRGDAGLGLIILTNVMLTACAIGQWSQVTSFAKHSPW